MHDAPSHDQSEAISPSDSAVARIVVFDFDGTITTDDTFRLFLKYYKGPVSYGLKILSLLPIFMAYGLRIIDRNKVKAHVIRRFFKGEAMASIQNRADSFASDVIPGLIRPAAEDALIKAQKQEKSGGDSLYICSASIGPYLRAYFEPRGVNKILATELKSESNICSGEIEGYNIWGEGKVRRILAEFAPQEVNIIEAYGDSRGDRELLNAAEASFYRPFRLSPT